MIVFGILIITILPMNPVMLIHAAGKVGEGAERYKETSVQNLLALIGTDISGITQPTGMEVKQITHTIWHSTARVADAEQFFRTDPIDGQSPLPQTAYFVYFQNKSGII